MEKVTFAAGCFWGVEAIFERTEGVEKTTVGYAGGNIYNPKIITFNQLLETFWMIHDPTQKNRQGPDIGTQYRSAIFYHNSEQKKIAEQSKKQKEKDLGIKIQTEIVPAIEFYPAEEYHQKYLQKQGRTSCRI